MSNRKVVGWIYGCFKKYTGRIIIISLLGALISVSMVLLALVSKAILDDAQHGKTDKIIFYSLLLLIIVVFQIAANIINGLLRASTSGKMDMHLKQLFFESIISKEYASITKYHSGELVNRFTSDIDVVVSGVSGIIPGTVSLFSKLIAGVVTILLLDPVFAVIIIAVGFFSPLIGRIMSKKYKYLHKETQRSSGIVRSFFQESIQNIIVIKTFLIDNPVVNKLRSYMRDNYFVKIKRSMLSVGTSSGLYGTFTLGYYGTIIWGAVGIISGSITYGTLMAFLQIVSQLRSPLQGVSGIMPQFYSTIASAERLMEIEGLQSEIKSSGIDPTTLYHFVSAIKGENLSFNYDEHSIIINSDFTIKKGSICAIIGESGSGKSTLFKMLLGLYAPVTGRLCFETDHGCIDINPSVRSLFSYVPQGDMILSGTIRENISFLCGDVDEEKIIEAAKKAVIYDYIASLPDGFDTVIGERGSGLSEGQLQRIAIARALLLDAPILLLDECTSGLDSETELQLLENLRGIDGKTVILITHRPAALDICDQILSVNKGRIKEQKRP